MRKTIYKTYNKQNVFKLHDFISEVYRKEHKKAAPDMFVGMQSMTIKNSLESWVLTVDGDQKELDSVEKIAKMIELTE